MLALDGGQDRSIFIHQPLSCHSSYVIIYAVRPRAGRLESTALNTSSTHGWHLEAQTSRIVSVKIHLNIIRWQSMMNVLSSLYSMFWRPVCFLSISIAPSRVFFFFLNLSGHLDRRAPTITSTHVSTWSYLVRTCGTPWSSRLVNGMYGGHPLSSP